MKKFTAIAIILVASGLAGYASSDVIAPEQSSRIMGQPECILDCYNQCSRYVELDAYMHCLRECFRQGGLKQR